MDGPDKLVSAIIATWLLAIAICVIGIMLARNGDFRAAYLYFQSIGLVVMLIVGIRGSEQHDRHGVPLIIAALAICAAIDFWLSARGPIYLGN